MVQFRVSILSLGSLLSRAGDESLAIFNSNTFGVIEFRDQFMFVKNSGTEYFTLTKFWSKAKC